MLNNSSGDKKEKTATKTKFKLFFVLLGIISAIGLLALYVASFLPYMVSPTMYAFKKSIGGVLLENFFLFSLVFLLVFSKDIKVPKVGKVLYSLNLPC